MSSLWILQKTLVILSFISSSIWFANFLTKLQKKKSSFVQSKGINPPFTVHSLCVDHSLLWSWMGSCFNIGLKSKIRDLLHWANKVAIFNSIIIRMMSTDISILVKICYNFKQQNVRNVLISFNCCAQWPEIRWNFVCLNYYCPEDVRVFDNF